MDLTPSAKLIFSRAAHRTDSWACDSDHIQTKQLRRLLTHAARTEFGKAHGFDTLLRDSDPRRAFAEAVTPRDYEDFRPDVMRMIQGEKDILWPGRCLNFAQSSGTSGGRSKFIPVTADSLKYNHYAGASDVVGQYLRFFPESRIFSGKGMILGGSFDTKLQISDPRVKIGDLSATLIDDISPIANLFRIPSKRVALLKDWSVKLDALANAAVKENITNISGVPSWFLRVLLRTLEITGAENIHQIWPGLEVFFHGGISFLPYKKEYDSITIPSKINYFETYNASEGFFATRASREDNGMLLLIDRGIYYEFIPLPSPDCPDPVPLGISDISAGRIYELMITSCNGLWRYRLGDTVEILSVNPVRLRVAGRTKSFINAFGEELMENNAEAAISAACEASGALICDYTAAPVYAHASQKGRHQWAIEWKKRPADISVFTKVLDDTLKEVNSDYAAKRSGNIFLDEPIVTTVPEGTFLSWLSKKGNGKLGGQRKIPRLRNDRSVIDEILHR